MARLIYTILLFLTYFVLLSADEKSLEFNEIKPLLENYCYKCHDADVQKGDFRIDIYSSYSDVLKDRKHWLKVLEQLETREMPTKNPLPTEEEYQKMIAWVDRAVNDVDWEKLKHPGHVTLPRLTNAEYENTIADLFGVSVNAHQIFTPDGEGKSGFTNDRDNLFLTSSQLEKYFTAAEWVIDSLVGLKEEPAVTHFEAEDMFMTESGSKVSDYPDGSQGYVLNRGQMTLYETVSIPHRGFYEFRVRFYSTRRGKAGLILRINDREVGEVLTEGREMNEVILPVYLNPGNHQMAWNIKTFPKPKPEKNENKPNYTKLPNDANDIVGRESRKNAPRFFPLPNDNKSNDKTLSQLVSQWEKTELGVQRPYEWLRLLGENGDPNELSRFSSYIKSRSEPLAKLKTQICNQLNLSSEDFDQLYQKANPKTHRERAQMLAFAKEAEKVILFKASQETGLPAVDWIKVQGPVLPKQFNSELAKGAMTALTNEDKWKQWFPEYLSQAFRREVNNSELDRYHRVYQDYRKQAHFPAAKQVLLATLVSPNFLYRAEEIPAEPKTDPYPLNSNQIASRLSYFLWQTMPDSELSGADLTNPEIRKQQLKRLLENKKAGRFYSTFPEQWLGYEALGKSVNPDPRKFPNFTPDLAKAMKRETQLWFQQVFQNNLPLTDLLKSGQSYINRDLAIHYQLDEPEIGDEFQLVTFTGENKEHRGGLLGMGSLLSATSTPTRTSPVLRGVFVMERLLGDDPGAPPADAGELPGNAGNRGKTLREELAIHRDAPACATCHDKIDPIGFGLDHFDAIGRFRETEGKKTIDASGKLPDGTSFVGVEGLRKYIIEQRGEDFVRVVIEKLLSLALGRELQT